MFDPKNGFNPNGPSQYSEEFQARYFKAQADRMNRLIKIAQDKLWREAVERTGGRFYAAPDERSIIQAENDINRLGPGVWTCANTRRSGRASRVLR